MPLPASHHLRAAPIRVAPRPDLARITLVGRLAKALRPVAKLEDPYARDLVLARAGLRASPRDRHDAAALERLRRSLPRLLDQAADGLAFVFLIVVWAVGYCLLCPPARAAIPRPFVADESFDVVMCVAAAVIFGAFVLAVYWWDTGRPIATKDGDEQAELSPETAPHIVDLWTMPRGPGRDRA